MFASQGNFAVLLLYSVIVGAGLGIFSNIINLAVNLLSSPKATAKTEKIILPASSAEAEKAMFYADRKIRGRDVALFIGDIVFFLFSAFAVTVLLFHLNYGEIRAFSLISALAGFVIYRLTFFRPVSFVLEKAVIFLKKILKKILKILLSPAVSLIKRIARPIYTAAKKKTNRRKARKYLALMEKEEENRHKKGGAKSGKKL